MRIIPQSHVDGFGLSSSFIVAELTLPQPGAIADLSVVFSLYQHLAYCPALWISA